MSLWGIRVQLQEGVTGTLGETLISCSLLTPRQTMCAFFRSPSPPFYLLKNYTFKCDINTIILRFASFVKAYRRPLTQNGLMS